MGMSGNQGCIGLLHAYLGHCMECPPKRRNQPCCSPLLGRSRLPLEWHEPKHCHGYRGLLDKEYDLHAISQHG